MKRLIIYLLYFLSYESYAQVFLVTYNTQHIDVNSSFYQENITYELISDEETIDINGTGIKSIVGVPKAIIIQSYRLDIDEYGGIISECGPTEQTRTLPLNSCNFINITNFNTSCSTLISMSLEITPLLEYNNGTTPSGSEVCLTDPIRLVASPGFDSYIWRATSTSGSSYFDPGLGNDVSFTLADVYGNDSPNFINERIYFDYLVGNCSDFSLAGNVEYKFSVPPPEIIKYDIQMPTCNGSDNGSIANVQLSRDSLTEKNEKISFYLANDSGEDPGNSSTGNYFNLKAGYYTLSLQTDQFEYCTENIPTKNITISEPEALAFTISNHIPANCYGSTTGSITIEPSGGQGANYEYSINNSNFDSDPIISGLTAGDHLLTVRDGNNCTFTNLISIAGPPSGLTATIAVTSDYNGSFISCPSSTDGSILLSASGGWGNYVYSTTENGTFSNNNEFHNLPQGEHTFWVMDESGCKASETVLIEPPTTITTTPVLAEPDCPGGFGSITINATGGSGTKEFSIDDASYQQSNIFSLFAGVYSIYVRDQNGCKYVLQDLLLEDPQPIVFSSIISNPTCHSAQDGALEITNVLHGVAPYKYSIDGGSTFHNSNSFQSLDARTYNIVIKDSQDCQVSDLVEIQNPSPITGDFLEIEISCFGEADGSLSIIPQGGNVGYSYLWSTGSATNQIEELKNGEYSVIIFDSNGCQSEELFYTLHQPSDIYVELLASNYNGSNVSCSGAADGSAEVLVSGGTIVSDYQYLWSNGTTGRLNEGLAQGNYTISVSDDNGCMVTEEFEILEPNPIKFNSLEVFIPTCYNGQNGSIEVFPEGGVGNYMLSLNDGLPQTSGVFENLTSGIYKIAAIDDNGCYKDTTILINQPDEITLKSTKIISTSCGQSNGSIEVEILGGNGEYTINWINENNDIIGQDLLLDSLESGQYSISITDQNGCNLAQSFSISNSDGPNLAVESIVGISCSSTADGYASILVTNGSPPYTIIWDNGAKDLIATNLDAGIHEVSVVDANGCKTYLNVDIPNISPIELSILEIQEPSCFGDSNGKIHLAATGGTPPYTYHWVHDGSQESDLEGLSAAAYLVNITDSHSCISEFEISLEEPPPLLAEETVVSPTCKDANDGEIYIIATGGTAPYSITYQAEPITGGILRNISSGNYVFEIQDSRGCESVLEVIVDEIEQAPIEFDDMVICSEQEITIKTPVPGIEFLWQHNNEFFSSDSMINLNKPGLYSLELKSNSGCTYSGEFTVTTSNDVLNTEFLASSNANVGDTIIVIDITFPLPDSINWVIPTEAEILDLTNDYAVLVFEKPGTFTVGLESYLGLCYDVESTQINVHTLPEGNISGRISENSTQLIESSVFPNPNNGKFNIHTLLSRDDVLHITFIDLITKKRVFHKSYESLEMTLEYELTDIKAGPYAIVIQAGGQLKVHRIVIH